jgi:hypothetical protein
MSAFGWALLRALLEAVNSVLLEIHDDVSQKESKTRSKD